VLAIDSYTSQIVSIDIVTYSNMYAYTIENISPGSYIVGASTDRDNDGDLFEPDDAYGYYMDTNNKVILELKGNQNLKGINFQLIDIAQ
jgi:hypothetical protein